MALVLKKCKTISDYRVKVASHRGPQVLNFWRGLGQLSPPPYPLSNAGAAGHYAEKALGDQENAWGVEALNWREMKPSVNVENHTYSTAAQTVQPGLTHTRSDVRV